MTSEVARQYPLAEVLDILEMTVFDLAEAAGLHVDTVRRAVFGGHVFKTNDTSAFAIAEVVGMEPDEIIWANGRSNLGRPAHTGRPTSMPLGSNEMLCPVHNLVVSSVYGCDDCAS